MSGAHIGTILAALRRLPYRRTVELVTEDDGQRYYVARFPELGGGVMTDGATRAEALHNLDSLFDDFMRAMIEWGEPIRLPAVHE